MARLTLTDQLVKELKLPSGRQHIEYFDSITAGLYLDVLSSGRRSYRLRMRVAGRVKILTLGDVDHMSLGQAREIAEEQVRVISEVRERNLAENKTEQLAVAVNEVTVAEFFNEQYLPYVRSYKRSWETDECMIRNHIVPKMGHYTMEGVTPPNVAKFVEQMKIHGYAPGTCNRALVLLRYGFKLALRWRLPRLQSNPAAELRNLRNDNRIEKFLTKEQVDQLIVCIRRSDNKVLLYIVMFLLYTGARKREVLDARWEDIDWVQKQWRIPKTKSGKIRHIPLSSGCMTLLEELFEMNKESIKIDRIGGFIFGNPKTGFPFVSIYYSWDTARKQAGLSDLRMHDLRHSFASFLVNAGRSLYEVQELLGHADIRTTSRYAHLSRERLFSAVEVIVPLADWGVKNQ